VEFHQFRTYKKKVDSFAVGYSFDHLEDKKDWYSDLAMSEDETNCDQSRCGIRIQVDPPSSLPPGNVHRPSNFASFTIIPTEAVHNNDHQGSAVQHEVTDNTNNPKFLNN
jgi:hypothetical protein